MPEQLEELVGPLLRRLKLTLATAESCTGGLISHRLTNVAGSSDYFMGGVAAYDNRIKMALLGVKAETLAAFGAVSRETALEMARGARERLGTDLALSTTGIAGPGGGTPEKPVGTVWIALSTPEGERMQHHLWQGSREENKVFSAEAALQLLMDYLEGEAHS